MIGTGFVTLSQVAKFYGKVKWAWPGWIPSGHVTMIAGPQAVGKTCFAAHLAATLAGRLADWPDGTSFAGAGGPVMLADTEEMRGAYAERLAPLGVADADIIFPSPSGDPTYVISLPRDAVRLTQLAQELHCSAVIVDSLSGGHNLDENSAAMRAVLQSLVSMAGQLQVPVIAVHHVRKRSEFEAARLTLDRVRGSSTITQFCRSVIGVYRPEEDGPSRVESIKLSFGKKPTPLGFTITDGGIAFHEAPQEPVMLTVVDRASELLLAELSRQPRRYSDLLERAQAEGIGKNALYRARDKLGVVTSSGMWMLPTSSTHRNRE